MVEGMQLQGDHLDCFLGLVQIRIKLVFQYIKMQLWFWNKLNGHPVLLFRGQIWKREVLVAQQD